jgi:hypothetical protein
VELILAQQIVLDGPMILAIIALVAGIAILIIPRLLNFIIAAYLIIVGLFGVIERL